MKRLLMFVFAIMPLLAFATDEVCPAGYYPAEYVELEYIESTGSQYINLNTKSSVNDIVSFKAQRMGTLNRESIFGAGGGGAGMLYSFRWIKDNSNISFYYPNSHIITDCPIDTEIHEFTIDIPHNIIEIDGQIYTINFNTLNDSAYNMYLFAYSRNGEVNTGLSFVGRIYRYKIHNTTQTLNLVPVRRLSDGAVGMFDIIGGKFYGNNGTGEFIAGPVVGDTQTTQHHICVSCPANTYKPNAGNVECTKCPTGTFSPIGSTQLSDCAKILHVGEYVVYMPLGKRTEHGLCVMVDGKKYCADVYERQ